MEQDFNKEIQRDEAYSRIREESAKDDEIVNPILEKILNILSEELKDNKEFLIEHGYMIAGRVLIYLSQALCDSQEMFNVEIDKAREVAIDRIIRSIIPKIEDGKIVEEGYDLENLSIRRIMISLGTAVDYALWRTKLSQYQEVRKEIEVEQEIAKQESTKEEKSEDK